MHVELLMPDRSLWSGEAGLVIAKTMDGDIGILQGHAPVFGILSPGSTALLQARTWHSKPVSFMCGVRQLAFQMSRYHATCAA